MILVLYLEVLLHLETFRMLKGRLKKEEELDWNGIKGLRREQQRHWLRRTSEILKLKMNKQRDIGLVKHLTPKLSAGLQEKKEIYEPFYQLCNMSFGLNAAGIQFL